MDDIAVENTRKLLQYAIDRKVAIDPQLALDALEGRLTQSDLGLPVLTETREEGE